MWLLKIFLCIALVLNGSCVAFIAPAFRASSRKNEPRKVMFGTPGPKASMSSGQQEVALPVLQFNLTSLLQIDNAKRIHLQQLYEDSISALASAQVPSSSVSTNGDEVSQQTEYGPALEPFRRFLRPYPILTADDMEFHGHFVVPPPFLHDGMSNEPSFYATMPSNVAFAIQNPLSFLRDEMAFSPRSSSTSGATTPAWTQTGEGIVMLSNLHQSLPSSLKQLEYISKVLTVEGLAPKISLLHVGTSTNNNGGDGSDDDSWVRLEVTPDTLRSLEALGLLLRPFDALLTESGDFRIQRKDVDLLRAVLCSGTETAMQQEESDEAVVETLIKLIDSSVQCDRPQLVLMSSSIQCIYVAMAIAKWKDRVTSSTALTEAITEAKAEDLLRRGLMVVTIGSLTSDFPDGPSYVHVAMLDDDLAADTFLPSSYREKSPNKDNNDDDNTKYNSKNAPIVLNSISPYYEASRDHSLMGKDSTDALYRNDAHNMLACSVQFLHLMFRINGASTFRQLHEQGSEPAPMLDISPSQCTITLPYGKGVGILELPQDEILLAFLQAMDVGQWLWNSKGIRDDDYDDDGDAQEDVVDLVLPCAEYAEATVAEYFGYDVYEELQDAVSNDTNWWW